MRKYMLVLGICFLGLAGGCQVSSVMFEPTPREKKVPAEFNLKQALNDDKNVLIVVDRSIGSGADKELIEGLTVSVGEMLRKNAKITDKKVHNLSQYSDMEHLGNGFMQLGPYEAGERTDNEFVLFVTILNYELYPAGHKDYYTGELAARASIYSMETVQPVWPMERGGKDLRMRVELETQGRQQALAKLLSSMAHGITRYLYDCKRGNFRSAYEAVDYTREVFE